VAGKVQSPKCVFILARIIFCENMLCHFATPSAADLRRAEAQGRRGLQQCSETYSGRPFTQRVMPVFITSPPKLSQYPSYSQSGVGRFEFVPIVFSSIILTSAPLRLCARLMNHSRHQTFKLNVYWRASYFVKTCSVILLRHLRQTSVAQRRRGAEVSSNVQRLIRAGRSRSV
jgi:hypothetical protein